MSVEKDFVLTALLQHNFLPTQKKDREELPPIFTSISFTPDVARKLVNGKPRKADGYQGYDAVDYRLTRFNGVSRSCSIPHPTAYAHLALCIQDNWEKIDYIGSNENSHVRPRKHADGRIVIMDYEKSSDKTLRNLVGSFGRRFIAHTDIANCFPSIYSHAIPWALVGVDHAKKHKQKAEWFNQLDEKLRSLKRNETQGVAIGPATSNIMCEVILARVDEVLRSDFVFARFIDDYTAYCKTEEEAQEFVRRLAEQLAKYKLLLNINKTEIISLPRAFTDDWVSELSLRLPNSKVLSAYDAVTYLNFAVTLAKQSPDGSVLKYALKSLLRRNFEFMAEIDVLRYALNLSFHQPVLLPLLEKLFNANLMFPASHYGEELQRLALENALFRRSDGLAWSLYYLNKHGVAIETETANEVMVSRDCVGLVLFYLSGDTAHQTRVVEFAKSLNAADLYELDQYWMLLYVLFQDGKIVNPYTSEDAFEILKDNGVAFVTTAPTP